MKKTKLFIKIAGIALILSLLSFNQESNAGPKKKEKQKDSMQEKGTSPMPQHPGLPMAMPTPEGGPDSGLVGGTGVQFSDKKANILKRMGTEKEGLDKAIVCITAAKKEEDLKGMSQAAWRSDGEFESNDA